MRKSTPYILVLAVLVALVAGCHKNNPTVVGTWSQTSYREVESIGGKVVIDTTISNGSTYSYLADDTYTIHVGSASTSGSYTYDGSFLRTTSVSNSDHTFAVNRLTDHDLTLIERDTIRGSIVEYTSYFTR